MHSGLSPSVRPAHSPPMDLSRPVLDRRQWLKVTGLALAGAVLAPARAVPAPPAPRAAPGAPPVPRPGREYVLGFEVDPHR